MAAAKKGTVIFNMANAGITGKKFGIEKLTCDYNAVGRKYKVELHGDWTDLHAVALSIVGNSTTAGNQNLKTLLANMDATLAAIIPNTGVICRTPQLNTQQGATFSTLTIIAEEGIQEGGGSITYVGPNMADGTDTGQALNVNNTVLPADTTYRFVMEPNDVALAYGMPFRKVFDTSMKWDLTGQAPKLGFALFKPIVQPGLDSNTTTTMSSISDILVSLGYDPSHISLLAICNIWDGNCPTEQIRGAIFQYLMGGVQGGGTGTKEYVTRILRGQTSYRYWVPHVTISRRYRTPPKLDGWPIAGTSADAYSAGAPPKFTGAPQYLWVAAGVPSFIYQYWVTGIQVEFSGEFWTVEGQWSGFVDFDKDLYTKPSAT